MLKSQQAIYCLPTNGSTLRGRESKTLFVQERSSILLKILKALLGPRQYLKIDFIKLLIPSELKYFAMNNYLYKHILWLRMFFDGSSFKVLLLVHLQPLRTTKAICIEEY